MHFEVRGPGPFGLLLLLLAAASGAVRVTASRSPFDTGRQLLTPPGCYNSLPTCECINGKGNNLCPDAYTCTKVDSNGFGTGGGAKPVCSNVKLSENDIVLPELAPGRTINPNGDLCTDWVNSGAKYLAPLYLGGDCTKNRLGALYAVYDCSNNNVCFKVSSCVGQAFTNAPRTSGNSNCPGIACGCSSDTEAQQECWRTSRGDDGSDNNWFKLSSDCGSSQQQQVSITGFSPKLPAGNNNPVVSGWEHCEQVPINQVRVIHVHFNADIGSGSTVETVAGQLSASSPYVIRFKTPSCNGNAQPTACSTASVVAPTVCPNQQKASAIFTITSTKAVTVGSKCPGATSFTPEQGMTGAGINTYTVECDRPQNGWDSTQILLRVTDNSGTQPACTTQVHVATVSVASVPTLTIAASQTAPALICWGAQEAKATFDVTADSTVNLQYEVESGCQRTITGTASPYTVEVTCTNSNGWKQAAVPVKLTVRDGTTGTCVQPQVLTQTVPVRPEPKLELTPPAKMCLSGEKEDFVFQVTAQNLVDDSWQTDAEVKALKGSTVTGEVTCTDPVFSANDRTFTTTCSPTSPRDSFSEDVDNFDKVRLKVTALRGTCTPTLVKTATAQVALAPYLDIDIDDDSLEVCETDETVDVMFDYVAKHGTVDSGTFTATPAGICTTQTPETDTVTVQCAWSPASSRPTVIELSGTLEGDAVCNDGSDEKSVTVTAKPEATLSITAPADNTICANVEKVTADFTYEATNVDGAVSFSWEPTECQKKSQTATTVQLECLVPSGQNSFDVELDGEAASKAPCTATKTDSASTTITVDSAPSWSLSAVGTGPLTGCAESVKASFTYSISGTAGTVEATAKVTYGSTTKNCLVQNPPPADLSTVTTGPATGTITVDCGALPLGSEPSIEVKLTLTKNGCTYTKGSTAKFGPLLCCNDDTSFAAIVSTVNGQPTRQTCFKSLGTTCTTSNSRWGFYMKHSDIKSNPIKFIAGGGADCTKGREVGYANLKCNTNVGGVPTSLTFEITNFAASVLEDQHYYVGCKPVTVCSTPAFGGTRANSLKPNTPCRLGDTDRNGKIIVACGDSFPASSNNRNINNGWSTQIFEISVADAAKAGCSSCDSVVWVVHQSGEYRGDPKVAGQCPVQQLGTTTPTTGRKGRKKRGRKTSP